MLSTCVGEMPAHASFNARSFSLTLNNRERITLASLGYAKTVCKPSCSERQQRQQCLCANKPRTPIFLFAYFLNVREVFEKMQ
jgi:hypothetical protein